MAGCERAPRFRRQAFFEKASETESGSYIGRANRCDPQTIFAHKAQTPQLLLVGSAHKRKLGAIPNVAPLRRDGHFSIVRRSHWGVAALIEEGFASTHLAAV